MDLQNLRESFWQSVRFFLVFVLVASVLYIILTKFMLKIPIADNRKLLSAITEYEKVIEKEKEIAKTSVELSAKIKEMEFDIYQIQKQDDIKRDIFKIQNIYKEHDMSSKYKFSLQVSRILKIYYDTREKNSKQNNNMELLSKNLTECQANL
ncbi:MAG: type VI secretion system TssO [Polaribacter sp.]